MAVKSCIISNNDNLIYITQRNKQINKQTKKAIQFILKYRSVLTLSLRTSRNFFSSSLKANTAIITTCTLASLHRLHPHTCWHPHTRLHHYIHACITTYTLASLHTRLYNYIHACITTYTLASLHTCLHPHTRLHHYIHACIHIHACAYRFTEERLGCSFSTSES